MTTTSQTCEIPTISPLMRSAWSAYNASFHETDREFYQELGATLYRQAIHEQVERLSGRSNEQNARIEAALKGRK